MYSGWGTEGGGQPWSQRRPASFSETATAIHKEMRGLVPIKHSLICHCPRLSLTPSIEEVQEALIEIDLPQILDTVVWHTPAKRHVQFSSNACWKSGEERRSLTSGGLERNCGPMGRRKERKLSRSISDCLVRGYLIGTLICHSQSQKNTGNQCATKVNMSINGPQGRDYKWPAAYEMQIPLFKMLHTPLSCVISAMSAHSNYLGKCTN